MFGMLFVCGAILPQYTSADTSATVFSGDIVDYMQTQKTTLNALFES
ncbi:MAG: hypothetical protein WCG98_05885 [bacterium]